MDGDAVICVEGLGKRYQLGAHSNERYTALRDVIAGSARSLLRRAPRPTPPDEKLDAFWALKDVSFEVKRGEVLGIIGRNGAGKSTLLKILSRITEPTEGRVKLRGRVASLLEVGTGFHPELTGRENISLNGAILGMSRMEIRARFDEIVAFAEVEKFLDTPVKRYSSGMYMRLAFAVAAHLEPEILIVDEVLAVGDAGFQKKCLAKIEEVGALGRTVLLVTHSMPTVARIASRAILLDGGKVLEDGRTDSVTRSYLSSGSASSAERVWKNTDEAPGDTVAKLHAVRIVGSEGQLAASVRIDETSYVEVEYWNFQTTLRTTAILHFVNATGICLFATNEFEEPSWWTRPVLKGLIRSRCVVPAHFLAEGPTFILVAVGTYNPDVVHALVRDAVSFTVVEPTVPTALRKIYAGEWPGVMRPALNWRSELLPC